MGHAEAEHFNSINIVNGIGNNLNQTPLSLNDKYLHGNQYSAYIGESDVAESYRLFAEKTASYFAMTERTSYLELENKTDSQWKTSPQSLPSKTAVDHR